MSKVSMGKVEKIIVLSVLFLVTLILVISLNTTDSSAGQIPDTRIARLDPITEPASGGARPPAPAPRRDPEPALDPAPRTDPQPTPTLSPEEAYALLSGEEAAPSAATASIDTAPAAALSGTEPTTANRGLLSSTVERTPPAAERIPAGSVLITMRGLEDSFTRDLKIYTLTPGDTLSGLAQRFYGDRRRASLLRSANEGMGDLRAGEQMFVPVFAPERGEDVEGSGGTVAIHLVEEGESLWSIAEEHYGAGAKWRGIFEANRDVMRDEHSIRVGMRLRIP